MTGEIVIPISLNANRCWSGLRSTGGVLIFSENNWSLIRITHICDCESKAGRCWTTREWNVVLGGCARNRRDSSASNGSRVCLLVHSRNKKKTNEAPCFWSLRWSLLLGISWRKWDAIWECLVKIQCSPDSSDGDSDIFCITALSSVGHRWGGGGDCPAAYFTDGRACPPNHELIVTWGFILLWCGPGWSNLASSPGFYFIFVHSSCTVSYASYIRVPNSLFFRLYSETVW